MFEVPQLNELSKKLFNALPESLQILEDDIRQKFQEILKAAFSRLDLVTREEFDVQTKVLARTREKLEKLQTEVNLLMEQNKTDKI